MSPAEREEGKGTRRERWRAWWYGHRAGIVLTLLIALFFLIVFWEVIAVPIRSGEQGVYWSRFFGGTTANFLDEGTAFKLPWDRIIVYDVRLQHLPGKTELLTGDGLKIFVAWSVRYRPDPARLPELHRTIGPDYAQKVIFPEVVSAFRRVIGNYRPHDIYAKDEQGLLDELSDAILEALPKYPIFVGPVLIRELRLPPELAASIQDKLVREQELLSYDYRLKTELQEKQRRETEASGIRQFEEISRISFLKWMGIQATVELAKSANTKIVILGTDAKQLPIILNAEADSPAVRSSTAAPSATPPGAPATAAGEATARAAPIGTNIEARRPPGRVAAAAPGTEPQ